MTVQLRKLCNVNYRAQVILGKFCKRDLDMKIVCPVTPESVTVGEING